MSNLKALFAAIPTDKKGAAVRVKSAIRVALKVDACVEAVEVIRGNGTVTGHKVGDALATLEVVREHVPKELAGDLAAGEFTDWQRAQMLTGELRRVVQLDKQGRFLRGENGEVVPRGASAV